MSYVTEKIFKVCAKCPTSFNSHFSFPFLCKYATLLMSFSFKLLSTLFLNKSIRIFFRLKFARMGQHVYKTASLCLILLAHLGHVNSFGIPEFLEFGSCAEADVVPDISFEKVRERISKASEASFTRVHIFKDEITASDWYPRVK